MTDQTKYTNKLAGARILIIGGTSGLGFAVAEACVEQGAAEVIVSSSNASRVEETLKRLKAAYPRATSSTTALRGYACNLNPSKAEELEGNIERLFQQVSPEGSSGTTQLDHVIYTAGDALAVKPLAEVDFAYIIKSGMTRFFGPLLVGKHAPKYMKPGPGVSITLTTGAVSEHPIPNWTVVGSYATGLHGMTRQLARDLAPRRVNLVSPGAVDTELWENSGIRGDVREKQMQAMAQRTATGRVARPHDVAEAYLYLLRDENVTGAVVSTNGGSLIM